MIAQTSTNTHNSQKARTQIISFIFFDNYSGILGIFYWGSIVSVLLLFRNTKTGFNIRSKDEIIFKDKHKLEQIPFYKLDKFTFFSFLRRDIFLMISSSPGEGWVGPGAKSLDNSAHYTQSPTNKTRSQHGSIRTSSLDQNHHTHREGIQYQLKSWSKMIEWYFLLVPGYWG